MDIVGGILADDEYEGQNPRSQPGEVIPEFENFVPGLLLLWLI
jgi:hypothetical protein